MLASIVERETARPEERPHVAAVFLNRLRLGMRLQSDPTVIYAVSGGAGTIPRLLTRADLDLEQPLQHLPGGRAAAGTDLTCPGAATIAAAAHPTPTDDLYFVADGTGHHAFAHTLEDHNRNVARWRAINAAAAAMPVPAAPPGPPVQAVPAIQAVPATQPAPPPSPSP